MSFILKLTGREIRSTWTRLLFFFLCIALGVGSVVALRSLIQNVTKVIGNDARALMTADLEVSTTSDFSPSDIAKIEAVVGRFTIVEARNETITAAVMARATSPDNPSVEFVELKGVEPPFPLVGDFRLTGGDPFDFSLLENGGAVTSSVLLEEMKLAVGSRIRVGEAEFQIRAVFDEEPGGTSGFRLGSRVFVEKKAFDDAGVTRSNSRVRRRILYRTDGDPSELVRALRKELEGTTILVNSYREQQENLSDQFTRMENYLSLTGLLILVLGGVGVWNVSRAFIEERRKTVAVLKCLGASGSKILSVYLLQIAALGVAGSIFGIALAQIGLTLAKIRFGDALPAKMSYLVNPNAAWQGAALGLAIAILFSILPLLQIRHIKPSLLLRDENNVRLSRLDLVRWAAAAVVLAIMLALAVWQAGSLRVGAFFLAGLAATTLVLYTAAWALTRMLKRIGNFSSFSLRQAVNSLYRPGNQTRIILIAVGLGAFVVITVQIMQANLLREFDTDRNGRLPSLIFVDIQKSQVDALTTLIADRTGETGERVPTVRARIAFVNGVPIDYEQREVKQQQGQIGREFAITYRDNLDLNETVIDGAWWSGEPTVPEVSVERAIAETLRITPGDSITFDISGRKVTARVASIRKIDVRTTRTAFVFVFRPGTLDAAPQTFALTTLKHVPGPERQRLQKQVLDTFPNVQIFDVADIVAAVNRLVQNFVLAISFVGSFVLLSGIMILIGSVGLTRSQRIYENAILKTLGARRRSLALILVGEYGLLGLLSGLIATVFSVVLSYSVTRWVMKIEWEFDVAVIAGGILITAALVAAVGTAASFDVLFRKPLARLRSH